MERQKPINLYLGRDKAGLIRTKKATKLSTKYKDGSQVQEGYKDYSELLMNKPLKQ